MIDLILGASMAWEMAAQPEYRVQNPLATVRIEWTGEQRDRRLYCEHISSVPMIEQGSGLNRCGIEFKTRLR